MRFSLTSDEWGEGNGQIVGDDVGCPQWRKFRVEPLAYQLKDLFGPTEIAEPVRSETQQTESVAKRIDDELLRGKTAEDLTPVTGRHQPSDSIERWAEIVTVAFLGRPRMHSHACSQLFVAYLDTLQRLLGLNCSTEGIIR